MNRGEKYLEIREKLKNLKQIKASDDFMQKLHRKIADVDSIKKPFYERTHKNRIGIFDNLFSFLQAPWFIPTTAVLILATIILYYTYLIRQPVENNQDLTSSKKLEQTDGNIPQQSLSEDKTSTETPPTKNVEKKPPNKDITGTLEKEYESKESSPVGREKPFTDADISKNYDDVPNKKYKSDDENFVTQAPPESRDLKKGSEKQDEETKSQIQEESVISPESGILKPNAITDSSKNKIKQKNPMDKLNILDKKALENLKEEITK